METRTLELITAMGLLTYLVRLVPFLVIRKTRLPKLVEHWITYVGDGILVSLLLPYILLNGKGFDISMGNVKVFSGIVCIIIAVMTKSLIFTIIAGIVCIIVLSSIVV